MKDISDKQIDQLARLSALEFDVASKKKMKNNLKQILNFVNEIESCDTSNCTYEEPEIIISDLREDVAGQSLSQKQALSNSSIAEKGYFTVPKVVE